jgi:predicted anti-sigma-YlaC factor YlaD
MNCHAAQRLLSAERDRALDNAERVSLEAHVAGCATCRSNRTRLAAAVENWKRAHAQTAAPDPERAWQDVHREIRRSRAEPVRAWLGLGRWAAPLGAAAAFAVIAASAPFWFTGKSETKILARLDVAEARADFVEVSGDASSLVYVDDQSGWLVVWAVNDEARPAGI